MQVSVHKKYAQFHKFLSLPSLQDQKKVFPLDGDQNLHTNYRSVIINFSHHNIPTPQAVHIFIFLKLIPFIKSTFVKFNNSHSV